MREDVIISDPPKRRAPTLYLIITGKLIKGLLALALAFGILRLIGQDLSDLFGRLVAWVHLDPENRFFSEIGDRLDQITPANVRWVAVATFAYSLISFVEGIGLMFRFSWAGWLAIGESAFFIPIEIFELLRRFNPGLPDHSRTALFKHPQLGLLIVLALNVLIVWYLLRNRQRLFRHHG